MTGEVSYDVDCSSLDASTEIAVKVGLANAFRAQQLLSTGAGPLFSTGERLELSVENIVPFSDEDDGWVSTSEIGVSNFRIWEGEVVFLVRENSTPNIGEEAGLTGVVPEHVQEKGFGQASQ